MKNQNNNQPADINMAVCDRNANVLPMLQTYTTKVLKPNIIGKKNILNLQMLNCEGYKYVIKWDFDLNGQTITVPKNCILEFDGGSLKNGTIIGQDTSFINVGYVDIWGENLTRGGSWKEIGGVQSNWTQASPDAPDYIKNKPNIYTKPEADNKFQHKGNYAPASDTARIEDLEQAVGNGGSVDSRIADAKSEVIGGASSDYNTLGKVESKIGEEQAARTAKDNQHDTALADRYTKEEVNNIVSRTPETDVIVIEVPAASQSDIAGWLDANTPSGTDPETGRSVRANKLYRVPGPDNTTFSEWAWDGTAYIMLANKDYGIDDEPDIWSNNPVKGSGIAAFYGYYTDNPLYGYVVLDNKRRFILGIKKDGSFEWAEGVPTPVKEYISRILEDYINRRELDISQTDNLRYLDILLDADRKFVSGHDIKGILHENAGIETPSLKSDRLELSDYGYSEISKKIGLYSKYTGKKIWWCGTSIPAAGFWNVDNGNSYPLMVGQIVKAGRVYNEAVGSSNAKYSSITSGISYEIVSRRMGNTIADALAICSDLWTIDDANQTVSAGPRSKGITEIPNVATYKDACYQRYLLLSNCYEIKLVSKYLISDPGENEAYLRQKFGNLYNTLVSLHPNAYNYQDDIDLFIIDHGHNDYPSPVPEENIGTTDMTTFAGAINTYIRLVMQYKPHARIMFISDYDNWTASTRTIEAQKQIADYWHIPFVDLRNYLPFAINAKVRTRGYWNVNGYWKEEGFTYNPNADTIAEAFSVEGDAYFNPFMGTTISDIASSITPEQDSDGVWWYYTYPRYIWIRDGLHPHSDKSGRCLTLYSEVISNFICNI